MKKFIFFAFASAVPFILLFARGVKTNANPPKTEEQNITVNSAVNKLLSKDDKLLELRNLKFSSVEDDYDTYFLAYQREDFTNTIMIFGIKGSEIKIYYKDSADIGYYFEGLDLQDLNNDNDYLDELLVRWDAQAYWVDIIKGNKNKHTYEKIFTIPPYRLGFVTLDIDQDGKKEFVTCTTTGYQSDYVISIFKPKNDSYVREKDLIIANGDYGIPLIIDPNKIKEVITDPAKFYK